MLKYKELCSLFEKLESIQSRNEMSLELANFFKKCNSQEVEIISYMIQGRVAPMFVKAEFNYSEKSLINLLSEYTSLDISSLRKEKGDIGDTIFDIWKKYSDVKKEFDIKGIYDVLFNIINTTGTGSITRKNKIVLDCLINLHPLESKYFVRTICGELRLGLSVRSLLDVFSITVVGDKSFKTELEQAYGVCSDIGYLGKKVFEDTKQSRVMENISNISVIPGIPILSRLVQRVGSIQEISERFENNVLLQPKFDGLRCQIHKWKENGDKSVKEIFPIWKEYMDAKLDSSQGLFGLERASAIKVKLFTRNLEDVTEMFPEIVESAMEMKEPSFILDSEIIGWNYKKETFLSYQETMQRRRKYSVESKREDIPVKAFAFDLLYLNGNALTNTDTLKRVKCLESTLYNTNGGIVAAETKNVKEIGDIQKYFNECIGKGLEGIIVKDIKGGYRPGLRNYEWVKVKKSIEKDLVDTIDMVVVGFYKGSGRRSTFGLGAILGAIFNEKEGTYDAICKIGTGMSDDILKDMFEKLTHSTEKEKPRDVKVVDNLIPDIWVYPKYVITVDADEITKNISSKGKSIGGGLSLRFPRLIEFDRDKSVEDITTVDELRNMFKMRKERNR